MALVGCMYSINLERCLFITQYCLQHAPTCLQYLQLSKIAGLQEGALSNSKISNQVNPVWVRKDVSRSADFGLQYTSSA